MSFDQVQRVAVRMYFDPTFARTVYTNPQAALSGIDLTEEERGWLTASDARRWRADALRPARALHAVIAEFPVSVAAAYPDGELNKLNDFFRSHQFHQAIMDDQALALAFGTWLGDTQPSCAPLAELEGALASARRGHLSTVQPSEGRTRIMTSPYVHTVIVPMGTLTRYLEAVREANFEEHDPVDCVLRLAGGVSLDWSAEQEGLLVDGHDGIQLSEIPIELAELLNVARFGTQHGDLVQHLKQHGSETVEAEEILEELLNDGLFIGVA